MLNMGVTFLGKWSFVWPYPVEISERNADLGKIRGFRCRFCGCSDFDVDFVVFADFETVDFRF